MRRWGVFSTALDNTFSRSRKFGLAETIDRTIPTRHRLINQIMLIQSLNDFIGCSKLTSVMQRNFSPKLWRVKDRSLDSTVGLSKIWTRISSTAGDYFPKRNDHRICSLIYSLQDSTPTFHLSKSISTKTATTGRGSWSYNQWAKYPQKADLNTFYSPNQLPQMRQAIWNLLKRSIRLFHSFHRDYAAINFVVPLVKLSAIEYDVYNLITLA